MKRLIFALILLLLPSLAIAADKWTKDDIMLEAACVALNVADYVTTDRILHRGDGPSRAMETNPFIGSHPSRERLMYFGIGSTVLHIAVAHYMPAKYRPIWQSIWIGTKGAVVMNNLHVNVVLTRF